MYSYLVGIYLTDDTSQMWQQIKLVIYTYNIYVSSLQYLVTKILIIPYGTGIVRCGTIE